MALTFTDGSTITVTTGVDTITLRKSDGLVTVAGKYTFTIGAFTLTSSGNGSYSQSGVAAYKNYLEVILSNGVTFRFYADCPAFDVRGLASVALAYVSSQSRWFTTLYRYGWEHTGGYLANYPTEWKTTNKTTTNPMDLSQWPGSDYNTEPASSDNTSGFYGQPYVSHDLGGIGHYLALGDSTPVLYEGVWTYAATVGASATLTVTSGTTHAFCLTTIGGFAGLQQYGMWQQRDFNKGATSLDALRCNAAVFIPPGGMGSISLSQANTYMSQFHALNLPIQVAEADAGWYPYYTEPSGPGGQGDWSFNADMAGYPAATATYGYRPGCWLSARVANNATCVSTKPADAFVRTTGTTKRVYHWGLSSNEYMWDHTTANGIAAIQEWATRIFNYGFRYCRWDVQRNDMWREFGVLWVFRQTVKALAASAGTTFTIETHMPYMSPVCDTVRTNDWFEIVGDPRDWKACFLRRARVAAMCVNTVIDTDDLGAIPLNSVTNALSYAQQQAKTMYGFGRPCFYWASGGALTSVSYGDATVRSYMNGYDTAVQAEVAWPTRTIVGDWDASQSNASLVSSFPGGHSITYNSATDATTFAYVPPALTASAQGDHISLAWTDTVTGEDGWYVERRVV